jgi:hypothetical protein
MVELHSNYTIEGSREKVDGVLPTNHALHETVEITQGISSWAELGFYLFTSAREGTGWQWVGDHIRPRVRAPAQWEWPVGASLSAEVGYQKSSYSPDTWTLELRPILDWERNGFYVSFNPTCDLAIKGVNANSGLEFSPNLKVRYDFTNVVTGGIEYYGALGSISSPSPLREQEQQIFPSLDLNLSPEWEFNCGVGVGLTPSTDHLIAKVIVGKRFGL